MNVLIARGTGNPGSRFFDTVEVWGFEAHVPTSFFAATCFADLSWSTFRCRQPDSRAAIVQIGSPELSVGSQELNANLDFSGRDLA